MPPSDSPALSRLTLALGSSDNPRLRLAAYFALTSNTAQVGARLAVPLGAIMMVEDGAPVKRDQVIFTWDPYTNPIIADVEGIIRFVDIVDDETITGTTPPGDAGPADVVVTTVGGAATLVELTQARANYVQALSDRASAKYSFIFRQRLIEYYVGDLDPTQPLFD